MLPAQELRLCPGSPLQSGPWPCEGAAAHPGMLFKTINLHVFPLKGTVSVKKTEVAETFLLEERPFILQNVSQ